jgi:hypothetical protein
MFEDADLVHRYTRADAIRDGVLVDVSAAAREAGIRYPVVLTRAVWERCLAVSLSGGRRVTVPTMPTGPPGCRAALTGPRRRSTRRLTPGPRCQGLLAGVRAPHLHRLVRGGAGEAAAVGAEAHACDIYGVPLEGRG